MKQNDNGGIGQSLCFDEDTAKSLALHNCRKCYGRGFHWFQKTLKSGVFSDFREKFCTCVEKRLKERVVNNNG